MNAPARKITLLCCILLCGSCFLQAQNNLPNSEQSCLHFTQAFYNWYITQVFKGFKANTGKGARHAALNYEGNPFSRELTRALIESDAEAKADGDPVLDFDPILNTQDPADRYVVRTVTRKNGRFWAGVYGVWSRPVSDQGKGPQVVAEVTLTGSRWEFVNFHYPNHTSPDNENLLRILRFRYHGR
jgi:hypothetical protein